MQVQTVRQVGDNMKGKDTFKIPAVPPTTSKSIRFPNDIIQQVEQATKGTDCTFSAFVIEATRWALENLDKS